MSFRIRIDPVAQSEIDHFTAYLGAYDEEFAIEQIERLDRIFYMSLAEAPLTWGYFPLTGAPYRGYLFRVGRRTQFWIIYTVDENSRTVDVLAFWNTARDPDTFDL